MPRDVIEEGHIKLCKATSAVVVSIIQIVGLLLLVWLLKHWIFNSIYELTGWLFAQNWSQVSFLFWPSVIFAGVAIIAAILHWVSVSYEIYPDRLLIRSGVLAKNRRSVDMDQFVAVDIKQGVWGRLFGYGDIVFLYEVLGSVVGNRGITLRNVSHPDRLTNEAAKYIRGASADNRGLTGNKHEVIAKTVVVSQPPAAAATAPLNQNEPLKVEVNKTGIQPSENKPHEIKGEINLS